jgi:hypothetical protein
LPSPDSDADFLNKVDIGVNFIQGQGVIGVLNTVGTLEDVAKLLVQQQFFDETENVIYGRTKDVKIQISGAKPVITALLHEIMGPISLLQEKNYTAYLTEVSKILTFNMKRVMQGFYKALENVEREDLTDHIAATFLIGELLTSIRETEFKNVIEEVKFLIRERCTLPDARIDEKLAQLYSSNDETVSLLNNLAMLRMLALAFGSPDFGKLVSGLVQQYMQALIEKLIKEPPNS